MPAESEVAIPRDVRVDQIGFAGELNTQFVADLKTAVKVGMTDKGATIVAGDFFKGQLVDGYSTSTADPAKLLKMYEAGEIKKAEFLSAIAVQNKPLTKFLSGKQIAAISTKAQGAAQLRITRKAEVEFDLVEVVKGLGHALAEKAE